MNKVTRLGKLMCLPMICFCCCRAAQLGSDQHQMRLTLLSLYEEQLVDNLIRARNNLPIIHLDYSNITGTVTHDTTGELSNVEEDTSSRYGVSPGLGIPAAVAFPLDDVFKSTLGYKGIRKRTNQLTLTAQPVIDNPSVYNNYLAFLSVPDRLQSGPRCPPGEETHLRRRFRGQCYWIPKEYSEDFFELALSSICSRGDAVSAPRDFSSTVLGVNTIEADGSDAYVANLQLGSSVPNDDGELIIFLKGRRSNFTILPSDESRGVMTDQVNILVDRAQTDSIPEAELSDAIANQGVRIRLENYRPSSRTDQLLESLRQQTELFRLDQQAR